MAPIVVGISGASGTILGLKCCKTLLEHGFRVDLVFSKHAFETARCEIEGSYSGIDDLVASFCGKNDRLAVYFHDDMTAPIASGSYVTQGMIVIPCSMATCAAISIGLSDTLLRRACDVMIKEKRKLVIVPRETPLSEIHLENLLKLTRLGVHIVPPMVAWYTKPKTVDEVENFIVGRALEALGISLLLYPRWEGKK